MPYFEEGARACTRCGCVVADFSRHPHIDCHERVDPMPVDPTDTPTATGPVAVETDSDDPEESPGEDEFDGHGREIAQLRQDLASRQAPWWSVVSVAVGGLALAWTVLGPVV